MTAIERIVWNVAGRRIKISSVIRTIFAMVIYIYIVTWFVYKGTIDVACLD